MNRPLLPCLAALATSFIALAGCEQHAGPPRVAAAGEVTLDGQPLSRGSIVFTPAAGSSGPKAATTIEEGRFQFDRRQGPTIGEHRVEIFAAHDLGFDLDDPRQFTAHAPRRLPPNPIPARYNERSELTAATRADGRNEFRFELTSQPTRR